MKRLLVYIFFLASVSLHAKERIDLLSYARILLPKEQVGIYVPDLLPIDDSYPMKFSRIREAYDLTTTISQIEYLKNFPHNDPNLKKILFFDFDDNPEIPYFLFEFHLPKDKMVLFKWEGIKLHSFRYDSFSIVYTIDDDLVDGVKFFKFYYPALLPMIQERTSFEDKKLCTMVTSNWVHERIQIVLFFETKPEGEFEFYGSPLLHYAANKRYRGSIPGYHSGKKKHLVLDEYRFSICFENTYTTNGYITEKIFDCFAAGCVPVYWGPDNVEKYIPKNCFIDYRDFQTNEELYQFLKTMTKEVFEEYIENIQIFLSSDEALLFSPDSFDKILYEAASR